MGAEALWRLRVGTDQRQSTRGIYSFRSGVTGLAEATRLMGLAEATRHERSIGVMTSGSLQDPSEDARIL